MDTESELDSHLIAGASAEFAEIQVSPNRSGPSGRCLHRGGGHGQPDLSEVRVPVDEGVSEEGTGPSG
jgi:hypothetical protein